MLVDKLALLLLNDFLDDLRLLCLIGLKLVWSGN